MGSATLLEGHLALAQIVSRGHRLAQSGNLSISAYGPEPVSLFAPAMQPQQQLWQSLPAPSSPMGSLISGADSTDLCSSPAYSAGQYSAFGSAASSPARTAELSCPCSPVSWAPVIGLEMPPAQQQLSCATSESICDTPAARRCLCASLHDSSAAAGVQEEDAEECSTPRASIIPAVPPCPGAPRAPRPAARALLPELPSGSSGHCAHLSMEGRTRLQQWLNQMELKLELPAGPSAPPTDACAAPKVGSARTSHRPTLTIAERASSAAGLSKPGSSACAPPAQHALMRAGQLSVHSSASASISKKRVLPALDTLSLSGSALRVSADGDSDSDASTGLTGECYLGSVRSSKRRSHDGASGNDGAAFGDTTPGAASSTSVVAGDLPAPAFDILGLLSGPAQQLP